MADNIKDMYKKVVKDKFPDTIKIDMGGQVLEYRKRVWSIYDADEKADVERGVRYGENPDQPAALYELAHGNITLGDVRLTLEGLPVRTDGIYAIDMTHTNEKLKMRGVDPICAVIGQDVLRYHQAVIDYATLALFLKEEPA